jgi:F-type H+-transporting ATPase subunit b
MKRAVWLAVVATASMMVSGARAQEPPKAGETPLEHAAESPVEGDHGKLELWKWANFLVLAGGLGYLIGKNAGPFFAGRSQQIRKDMFEAQEARKEAEARAAEIDRRMAGLAAEIAALRSDSEKEAQSETERLSRHTAAEMAKIQAHAEQEIASAGKAARLELKRYSAALAIELAEQRIRSRMTPDLEEALVRGFVRDLEPPSSRAAG